MGNLCSDICVTCTSALCILITLLHLNQLSRYLIFSLTAVSVSSGLGLRWNTKFRSRHRIWYGGLMVWLPRCKCSFKTRNQIPFPTFMLTNELETLPTVWEPFWSTPIGLIRYAIGIANIILFDIFGYG